MSSLPNQMGQTSATCCVDLQDADEAVDEAFASPPDADAMVAYQASADGAVLGGEEKGAESSSASTCMGISVWTVQPRGSWALHGARITAVSSPRPIQCAAFAC